MCGVIRAERYIEKSAAYNTHTHTQLIALSICLSLSWSPHRHKVERTVVGRETDVIQECEVWPQWGTSSQTEGKDMDGVCVKNSNVTWMMRSCEGTERSEGVCVCVWERERHRKNMKIEDIFWMNGGWSHEAELREVEMKFSYWVLKRIKSEFDSNRCERKERRLRRKQWSNGCAWLLCSLPLLSPPSSKDDGREVGGEGGWGGAMEEGQEDRGD